MKIVDARGLQQPEPFERVVDVLTELALGDQMKQTNNGAALQRIALEACLT